MISTEETKQQQQQQQQQPSHDTLLQISHTCHNNDNDNDQYEQIMATNDPNDSNAHDDVLVMSHADAREDVIRFDALGPIIVNTGEHV